MNIMEYIRSMMSCESTEDKMNNFTIADNLYEHEGYDTPSSVSEVLGDDFSSLKKKEGFDMVIETMMIEEEGAAKYPLLGDRCVSRFIPSIHEHIGEGTTGHVYSMSTRIGPVAVKFQNHSSGSGKSFTPGNGSMDVSMNEFTLEVAFQLHMSSIGISPAVYNAWISPYTTIWGTGEQDVLVMDRLEETLFEKTSRESDYTRGVMEVIARMHENDVFHGDMHSGNIMIDQVNNPLIIDFGRSKSMPSGSQEKKWCMVHDYVLLYLSLLRRSELKPVIKNKILELAPNRTVLGTTFDLGE